MKLLKKVNAIVIAVLMCLFGTLFILRPELTSQSICLSLAVCLCAIAAIFLVRFFKEKQEERVGNEMSTALLLVIGAVFLAIKSEQFVQVVPYILAFLIVYDGTVKTQNSYFLRKSEYPKWASILLLAFMNLAVGIFLLWNPVFETYASLITALGVGLLFSGVSDLVVIIILTKFLKRKNSEVTVYNPEQ